MKRLLKIIAALVAGLLIVATVFAIPTIWGKPWFYNHFTLRVLLVELMHSPQMATQLGMEIPFTGGRNALDDLSPVAFKAGLARLDQALEMHGRYERPEDAVGALSYDVFGVFLETLRAVNGVGRYTITHLDGPHLSLPDFLVQFHRVDDADSAKSYLARLSKVPRALEQAIAFVRFRAEEGWVAPTFILEKIINDTRAFTDEQAADNAVVVEFARKLREAKVPGADDFVKRATSIVEKSVYPAYQRYAQAIEALLPKSTHEPGLWKYTGGPALYQNLLRLSTTTELSPEDIHALGVEMLKQLEPETRLLLKELGVERETIGAGLRKLAKDPRMTFPRSDEGEEQALEHARELVAKIDQSARLHFGVRPESGVEVKQVPPFKEESAPLAYYSPPAIDGSRGGLFFLNLRDVGKLARHQLPTLICHEAIPGHHFQIGIAQSLKELPLFRRLVPFVAYNEGWALYAERFCDEIGVFDTAEARLGFLAGQMLRAARLVVDTGLHHGKWSREQAVDYMVVHTGIPMGEVEAEVDRYTMWPGQACGYMIGQLKLLEIRKDAEERLADAFDVRAFHDRVLTFGSLPLGLLGREMDVWVEARKVSIQSQFDADP